MDEKQYYTKEEVDLIKSQLINKILEIHIKLEEIKNSQIRDISSQWKLISEMETKLNKK